MLLMNLKAHTPALTLLANLPFEKSEIKADELEIRAVLRAAYRLLKAMCTDFPLMQTELVASIPLRTLDEGSPARAPTPTPERPGAPTEERPPACVRRGRPPARGSRAAPPPRPPAPRRRPACGCGG